MMRERSKRYVLQTLFVSLPSAGGSENDLREFILHVNALMGKNGRARDELKPCLVVGCPHGIHSSGPKNGANS